MSLTKKLYKNIIRKDLILKILPETIQEIPEIEKLEVRIIFPKVVDDFSLLYTGIIYIEEFCGQFPLQKTLSKKRISRHEYEKSVLLKSTLRKDRFFNFLFFLSIALLYFWIQRNEVLVMRHRTDWQNKIVQLSQKEFFYLFNMPIEYDERQDQWKFQLLFYFKNNIIIDAYILSNILSYFFFYDLLNITKGIPIQKNTELSSESSSELSSEEVETK